jgi:hypothetical protein
VLHVDEQVMRARVVLMEQPLELLARHHVKLLQFRRLGQLQQRRYERWIDLLTRAVSLDFRHRIGK